MEDSMQKEELWNSAMAYLKRLDDLFTLADYCHMNCKMERWYRSLYCIYKELYPKMKPQEQEKAGELLKILTLLVNDSKANKIPISHEPFIEFELYLRVIMEERSMFTPRKDISGL